MSVASQTLFNSFQLNLNQHKKLDRNTILTVAKQCIDHFFLNNPAFAQPQPQLVYPGVVTTTTPGLSNVISDSVATVQWSRIVNTKEFGLPTFFKERADQLKAQYQSINYFKLVKMLRDEYETQPHLWSQYINWVRQNHPQGATLKDPSPRKEETTVVQTQETTAVPTTTPETVISTPAQATQTMVA